MDKPIGKVVHFYSKIGVAVIELTDNLKIGDRIRIKGHTTDFEQPVESMQIEKSRVDNAIAGQAIGLKVNGVCKEHDVVYKVE
ncbi:MAG: translation elongation factor-like protein [Candidatus Woesearchaeota archaeon]